MDRIISFKESCEKKHGLIIDREFLETAAARMKEENAVPTELKVTIHDFLKEIRGLESG